MFTIAYVSLFANADTTLVVAVKNILCILKQELRADHYLKEVPSSQHSFPTFPGCNCNLLPSLNIRLTCEANSFKQSSFE